MRNKSVGVGVANTNLIVKDATKFIISVIMMSEKRFTIKSQDDYWAVIDNYNSDKVCIINGIHTEIEAIWLCDFMNEQQSIIDEQKIAINEMITDYKNLEKEKGYWKRKAMILLMQVRRLTPRMTDKEVREFSKELEEDE